MSPLPLRAITAAYAAATFFVLAPSALAAKGVPAQPSHGEDRPLDLPLEGPKQADPTGASGGGSLVRTFVGLAIVVAVIYGLYWVLRQVKSSREEKSSGHGLSSEAVVALGPGRSLHLVRAGRELVLVGVAEHGVTPIRTYSETEAESLGLTGHEDEGDLRPLSDVAPARRNGPMTIGDALDKLRGWTVRQ